MRENAMDMRTETSKIRPLPAADNKRLVLDEVAIEAARQGIEHPSVPSKEGERQADIIALLNDSMATELVCVLRYRRHHFTARGLASPRIAEEFLVHAGEELAHADQLARRIVQLGGLPDFAPDTLARRSHAAYDDYSDLKAMIKADLVAERVAIESYRQIIALVGTRDPSTRRMLEDILRDEERHAEELKDWLAD
jgi:bacterioferritin